MKQLSKNILATLSGIALVVFPQLSVAEEEEKAAETSNDGAAAGEAAGFLHAESAWDFSKYPKDFGDPNEFN